MQTMFFVQWLWEISVRVSVLQVVFLHFQGRLLGEGIDEQLPTIAIVTHYDSYGIAPVRKTSKPYITITLVVMNSLGTWEQWA